MNIKFISFASLALAALVSLILVSSIPANPALAAGSAELVMFDSPTCTVCRKFNAEIGDAGYAARKSSTILPLRRIDINRGKVDFQLSQPVTMTPTFVFVQNGAEIARFYGYPGREHFFTLIDAAAEELAKEAKAATPASGRN